MEGLYDSATLFNLATLHLHVPPAPPQHTAPPSTSLLNSGLSADEVELQEQETDAWVSAIARAEEREQAYYDETLPFYLLIRLPSAHPAPSLNRAQAASFLLPSLQAQHGSQPHLSLSADVSYIEGAPTPAQATEFQSTPSAAALREKRNSISSTSALGRGPPPSSSSTLPARRGSLPPLDLVAGSASIAGAGPKVPLTPSPFPSTRANDSQYASAKEGVSLWSYVFGSGAGPDSREKGKGKQGGRVWVGREQVEGGAEGDWIGVWEFGGDVAFVRTPLVSPRLCLTITATLRDDPRLTDLLERARTPTGHSRNPSGVNGGGKTLEELMAEEEEYLVESFDDVNLLSSLSGAFPSAQPLHLPASRLPLPTTSNSTPSHPRRTSRASISLPPGSLPPVAADAPLHPSIRRAVRRVLNVKSALNVRMRTVPCSVEGLGRRKGFSEDLGSGIGMEGAVGGEGLIMCVEVEGGSTSPDESTPAGDKEDAFEIESVSVEMTNGSTSSYVGDVEIREILGERTSSTFPLLLGAQEQHNFLYAVTFSSEAAQLASLHHSASLDFNGQPPSFEPVPIGVATSPSQRFTARFGEEPTQEQKLKEAEKQRERERAQQTKESPWLRGVAIVVKGRPVRVIGGGRGLESGRSEGRSLTSGYSVEDAAPSPTMEGEVTIISPTNPFASRWNCTLDISPFAQRSPPKRASFNPPAPVRPTTQSTLSSAALARLSTSSAPFPASPASKRNSRADMPQVEAVAGSKRHTMASLASLASKSPVLIQRGFKRGDNERPHLTLGALPPRLTGDARALPPTPFDVQTPGATGPPRRFFSLPPGAGNESPYNTPGQHQSFSSLSNPSPLPPSHTNLPPTPAYPPHLSTRNSLPHADPLSRRFDGVSNSDPRRESWNTAVMAPGFDHGVGGRGRDWNVSPSNSVGLGFDGAGAGVPTDADLDKIIGGRAGATETRSATGNIVVSISLIPLRKVKSQLPPPNTSLTPGSDSLSSPEVDLHAGRLSPHATFQFPSPSSSPDPSRSPDPSSNDLSAAPTPPPFITERRRSSSIYPSPAPAPKAKAPPPRAPRIGLLDVFLVEVFIVNRGDEVKRFTVGVPVKRLGEGVDVPAKGDLGIAARGIGAGLTAEGKRREDRVAKIVALENDVRIGPLAPNTCASVRLRFLAIRPGAHTLEELRLVDLGTGLETRLRNPLSVVVEG
ncbi:TRAPP trafficking subunit Trs65-domain-containing protein [Leucosporidium creatinivorum]|uniref:TRAPP trafficking subunit Trs65-domain-containing protein n=1 Tax=Leucosporidium creatinivorum TaxID=106004 RepID=A0A1Y2F1P3_9BASI|nr:TRAPP trafficking subunit Trs65-domain-containing protein [Leucosporidium creatinivorum]